MKWLVLSYLLSASFHPQNSVIVFNQSSFSSHWAENPNSLSLTVGGTAEAFNLFRLTGNIQTYAYPTPNKAVSFQPFRSDYFVSASLFYRGLEVGIMHECDHPTVSFPLHSWSGGNETSIFLTLKGSFSP